MAGDLMTGEAADAAAALAFGEEFAREGEADAIASAKAAGHGDVPARDARALLRKPSFQRAIKLAVANRASTEGMAVALQAMISIARNGSAPEEGRIKAALAIPRLLAAMRELSQFEEPSALPSAKAPASRDELLRAILNIAEGSAHAVTVSSQ